MFGIRFKFTTGLPVVAQRFSYEFQAIIIKGSSVFLKRIDEPFNYEKIRENILLERLNKSNILKINNFFNLSINKNNKINKNNNKFLNVTNSSITKEDIKEVVNNNAININNSKLLVYNNYLNKKNNPYELDLLINVIIVEDKFLSKNTSLFKTKVTVDLEKFIIKGLNKNSFNYFFKFYKEIYYIDKSNKYLNLKNSFINIESLRFINNSTDINVQKEFNIIRKTPLIAKNIGKMVYKNSIINKNISRNLFNFTEVNINKNKDNFNLLPFKNIVSKSINKETNKSLFNQKNLKFTKNKNLNMSNYKLDEFQLNTSKELKDVIINQTSKESLIKLQKPTAYSINKNLINSVRSFKSNTTLINKDKSGLELGFSKKTELIKENIKMVSTYFKGKYISKTGNTKFITIPKRNLDKFSRGYSLYNNNLKNMYKNIGSKSLNSPPVDLLGKSNNLKMINANTYSNLLKINLSDVYLKPRELVDLDYKNKNVHLNKIINGSINKVNKNIFFTPLKKHLLFKKLTFSNKYDLKKAISSPLRNKNTNKNLTKTIKNHLRKTNKTNSLLKIYSNTILKNKNIKYFNRSVIRDIAKEDNFKRYYVESSGIDLYDYSNLNIVLEQGKRDIYYKHKKKFVDQIRPVEIDFSFKVKQLKKNDKVDLFIKNKVKAISKHKTGIKVNTDYDNKWLEITKQWWFLSSSGDKVKINIPNIDYDYEKFPVITERKHPIPEFTNIGTEDIEVSMEILIDMINIAIHWWHHSYTMLYAGFGWEVIQGFFRVINLWYNLDDSQKQLESLGSKEDYNRIIRFMRWEAEKIYFLSKQDEQNKIINHGNYYMKIYIDGLLDFLDYHYYTKVPLFDNLFKMDSMRNIIGVNSDPHGDIINNFSIDKILGIREMINNDDLNTY